MCVLDHVCQFENIKVLQTQKVFEKSVSNPGAALVLYSVFSSGMVVEVFRFCNEVKIAISENRILHYK